MFKKQLLFFCFLIGLFAFVGGGTALAAAEKSPLSGEVSISTLGVDRIGGYMTHNDAVMGASLRYGSPVGIYGATNVSFSPTGKTDGGDSVGLELGTICHPMDNIALNMFARFDHVHSDTLPGGGDKWRYGVTALTKVGDFSPSLTVEGIQLTGLGTDKDGFFYQFGTDYNTSVAGQDFNLSLFLGGNDGAVGLRGAPIAYWRTGVSTTVPIGRGLSVVSSLSYQDSFVGGPTGSGAITDDRVYASLGVQF